MDDLLFRRFKDSLDEPDIYQGKSGRRPAVILRKEKATIPVILSAPHGGGERRFLSPTHSMKSRLLSGNNVSLKSDLYTLQMLACIDKDIFDVCCQHCYIVGSTVHRRHVDPNRNALNADDNAYHPECPESEAYYQAYHTCLADCLADCRVRHPRAPCILLLDIHGQATYHDMVVLGTLDRTTCAMSESGTSAAATKCDGGYCGEVMTALQTSRVGRTPCVDVSWRGFIWHLQRLLGRASLPSPGQPDISPYRGGHIVDKYGAQGGEEGGRVAAVQLEFGAALRADPTLRGAVARSTALAVARSLWPASYLGVRLDESSSTLVPTPLCRDILCPHTSHNEHETLAGLLTSRDVCLHFSPHPWETVISSRIDTISRGGALCTWGSGEVGHAVVRRIFFPGDRRGEEDKDLRGGEKGWVQSLVYTGVTGHEMRHCNDAGDEDPNTLIRGCLVSYGSDGEVAMARLEIEGAARPQSELCDDNALTSSGSASIKWDVCQVNVSRWTEQEKHKTRSFLAFICSE